MIAQDGTLPEKTTGLKDGALPELGQQFPGLEEEGLRDKRLAQAAVIRSEIDEVDVTESFANLAKQAQGNSAAGLRKQASDEYSDEIMTDAREIFYQQAIETGEDLTDTLTAINTVDAIDQQKKAQEDQPIRRYVDAMARHDLPMEVREKLATDLYLQDKLNEFTQGISGWETARDLGLSVVISPKDLYDAWQVTGEVSPFKQEEVYRKFAHWFQHLDNEKKIEVWPSVQEYLVDAMPRDRAAAFMQGLIDPAGVEAVGDELSIWGSVDAALLGVGAITTAFKLRKVLNPIKAAVKAGDYERAASTNFALMDNPGAGKTLDVDDFVANTNALPFLGEKIDDAVASDLSPAVHERIFQFRDKLVKSFTDLSEAKTFMREGFVDTNDLERAERRLHDEYDFYVTEAFSGKDKITKLDSTEATPGGMKFNYTVTNADGTEAKGVFESFFNFDDIGFWQHGPRQNALFSELMQARKTDFMSTVKAANRLDNTTAAVASQLRDVIKEASKPIKGRSGKPRKMKVEEVDQVLITGDDMGKEFTPQELKAGVNGIKLDDDQIEYYYNMRQTMNGLGILRNMDARRGMAARGVKNIRLNDAQQFFGTPIQEAAAAQERLRNIRSVWKVDGVGMAADTANMDMKALYDEGFRLVKLEEDTILGGNRYQHMLVKTDSLGEMPAMVLDLKKGYIPRINQEATWFVQRFTSSKLDGVDDVVRKALMSFDNKAEAEAYAARMYTEHGDVDGLDFRVVADKELEAFKAGESGMTQSSGLIYSPRAREPVPHNGSDIGIPRTSALESIELYLENTKNYMTRNDWRMGLRKKWENTAKFKLGKTVTFEDGKDIANEELRTMWEKINNFSGFMDKSERKWEELVKGVYEFSIDKFGRNRVSDFILTQRQKDPLARLRSATFHTLLGTYNPIQLWVQAQGAAVAASMNLHRPAVLQRLFRQQGALKMLQHVHFNDSPETLKKLSKAFGYESVDEMLATEKLWKKSGFYDSVLSNADVEAAARGFPTTRGAVKRFFDSGLVFFREGELFNRRLAFLTAMEELGGAEKLLSSDKLFKEAIDRTNGLILNLGKSNRAAWQKGVLSIPTQFLQIQAKTLESLSTMNGVFTKAESARLLMGQFALYGAAGAFMGQWALRAGMELAGKDQIDVNNMNEGMLKFMTGGLTDWMGYIVGANIVASDRGALLNGMDQSFLSFFTDENSGFSWLFGPSSVGPERLWTKMRELATMFPVPQDINGQVSFEAQDIMDTFQYLMAGSIELGTSPFASTSQVQKYMLMRDLGILRDKNNNIVAAPVGGFDWQTEIAALIGFKPELLQRKYDLSEINEETRKYVEFRTSLMVKNWQSFLQEYERARVEGRDLDEDTLRRLRKRHNVLLNSITDPGVRRRVLDSYSNKLRGMTTGNSQLDRQYEKFYENMLLDVYGTFTSTDTRLIQTRDTE